MLGASTKVSVEAVFPRCVEIELRIKNVYVRSTLFYIQETNSEIRSPTRSQLYNFPFPDFNVRIRQPCIQIEFSNWGTIKLDVVNCNMKNMARSDIAWLNFQEFLRKTSKLQVFLEAS